jgi:hypothetical protein
MGLFGAVVLALTAGVVILHLVEWGAVPSVLERRGSGPTRDRNAQRLRLAVCLEALYYLAAVPILFAVSNSLTGRLMIVSAAYHWGGFALLEVSGFWRRKEAGPHWPVARRLVLCSIALLDMAEVMVLASFGRALYASLS